MSPMPSATWLQMRFKFSPYTNQRHTLPVRLFNVKYSLIHFELFKQFGNMQKRVELYKPTVGVGLMFAYLIAVLSLILGILSLG